LKIKAIKINNFIGIDELNWNPSLGVNVIEGPKGVGKSSILEAIETTFSNHRRRTEVIQHGENEATLYVETDTGLEIDRKLRNDKADYMKLRQEGKGINSTETELRKFLSGDIFRPLDFINLPIAKQTEIILNMIEIDWSIEDIKQWFGEEILGINYDKHILQVLKDIETKLYKEREEVNRAIHTLQAQVKGIEKELPANYNGDDWKDKNVQEYYNKVNDAQKINQFIEKAKALSEGFETKVSAIKSDGESQKDRIHLKYRDSRQDIKDIIDLSKGKIEKAKEVIDNIDVEIEKAKDDLTKQKQEEIRQIELKYERLAAEKVKEIGIKVDEVKELVNLNTNKIEVKQQELIGLDDKESLECESVDKEVTQRIENEKTKLGNAAKYIEENQPIEIEPLQKEAEEVANMQSFLREWDRMQRIINGELATRQRISNQYTAQIETARTKPSELLKTHVLPIEGIGVDENGMIRINGTLLDGLSDGEKLETAFNIALQRMGSLKIICLDGLEKLNESEQKKVMQIVNDNDIQCFVTITKDTQSNDYEFKEVI
jgi:exonuclease SbcC